MIKSITKTFLQGYLLKNLIPKFSTSSQREFILHPSIKHSAQINIRAMRRKFLKQSVLNHNKIVLWAEKRKLTDRIIPLRQQGKCVGIIKRHPCNVPKGQETELDIVMPAKMIRAMRKNRTNGLMQVHVRIEEKQYRCVLSQINMHHELWIQQVVLIQYVPNEPNTLTIPITITHFTENPYFHQGSQFDIKKQSIEVICYNQEYPLKFFVDTSFVCPQRPYRIGDLANTFPPGLILSPQTDSNQRIFQIMNIPKMQLHLKQKLMKSYLASTKKQKIIGGQPAGGATGAAGTTPAGGAGDKAAPKK